MDSFNIADLKVEKANAILRYRRLQRITSLLRFVELCVVLIVISKYSTQFSAVFGLSGEFFRRLSVTLFSPRFVFVIGNAIVIVLFILSGRYTNQGDSRNSNKTDLYEQYVEIMEKNKKKQSVCEDDVSASSMANTYMYSLAERKIHRTHSVESVKSEKPRRELRRSATEMCKKSVNSGEKVAVASDEMSSEEFRQTVEAFIARQQKFLREEEFSAIVS
ncbi:uncharacterized protein LOC132301650 [Cornus florida]|uniref:uncharacterized protein LOC132301650 n=1 Tax=Cornus florida TaxID=4283 RepID=UPI00289E155D|nr:uncharacterized protein LOC132301650 [Cornus florida]